ncbi:helix-turn-helix domain-containing protein, partial [Desulfovulcanus sp.]
MVSKNLGRPLTVVEVAQMLGVSRSWVYSNWRLLGGVKLAGSLRFFEKRIEEVINALQEDAQREASMGGGFKNS